MADDGGRNRFPLSGRQIVGIVLVVVAVIFILQNRRRTTVRFLIPEVMAPLWVALFVSVLGGIVAGARLAHRRRD